MTNFLSTIIFTLPGILTFLWLKLLGVTSSKQQNNELLAISALLWVPIVSIIMIAYQVMARLSHFDVLAPKKNIPILKKDWHYFKYMSDFKNLSNSYWFLLFFLLLSIILSFILAKFISRVVYKKLMDYINRHRVKNNLAPFSSKSTVWEETFINNVGQIVEISSLSSTEKIYGEIKNVSRPLEPEHSLVLDKEYFWDPVFRSYNVSIDNVYIDTKSGLVIKIFNYEQAIEAGKTYIDSFKE